MRNLLTKIRTWRERRELRRLIAMYDRLEWDEAEIIARDHLARLEQSA